MIIADTNVVSEFMKDAPDPGVMTWAETLDPTALLICAVTVAEIERGLGRISQGRRRRELERRWVRVLQAYAESVVVFDIDAAQATARILGSAEASGRPMSFAGAEIAGICVSRGHALATRNVRDFDQVADLTIIDPLG